MSVVAVLTALLSGFIGGVMAWAAARYLVRVGQPAAVGVPVGVGVGLARLLEASGFWN